MEKLAICSFLTAAMLTAWFGIGVMVSIHPVLTGGEVVFLDFLLPLIAIISACIGTVLCIIQVIDVMKFTESTKWID